MGWLLFDRGSRRLSVFDGPAPDSPGQFVGPPVQSWPAHNDTASRSNGRWPPGIYRWSHYNPHGDMGAPPVCFSTALGCQGIHVFAVAGRPGLGIHAGRTRGAASAVGGVTMGCIRVSDEAMMAINALHTHDRIMLIDVL